MPGRVPGSGSLPGAHARRTLVLAGNPNVGKSVFFNVLTGTYVDVSNFPGTTVEIMRGRRDDYDVLDTPGVYGVGSFNDEEAVARDVILAADVVINVVDAVHPERDLFLTLQLVDLGLPMIVALNMADEARRQGVAIDRDLLEDLLGVPVVETVAVEGVGFEDLLARIPEARPGHADHVLEAEILPVAARVGTRAAALLVLEGDEAVAARYGVEPGTRRDAIYTRRRARVDDIVGHVVRASDDGLSASARLSRAMIRPITGIPLLAVLLLAVYKVLGEWVAGDIVGFTEETVMQGLWEPFIRSAVGGMVEAGSALHTFLVGEFGVLTMTPTY
ncbi:MAG TPA: FeoB small GTPase domain-containing protein, partial [Coriobacteriia bacterium]|nr:FeoB small GTPase domain-containing protein [Coriobacteriia bacterium]